MLFTFTRPGIIKTISFFLIFVIIPSQLVFSNEDSVLSKTARGQTAFENSRSEIREQIDWVRGRFLASIISKQKNNRSELREDGAPQILTSKAIVTSQNFNLNDTAEIFTSVRFFGPANENPQNLGIIEIGWNRPGIWNTPALGRLLHGRFKDGQLHFELNPYSLRLANNGSISFHSGLERMPGTMSYFVYEVSAMDGKLVLITEENEVTVSGGKAITFANSWKNESIPMGNARYEGIRYTCYDASSENLWVFTKPVNGDPYTMFCLKKTSNGPWERIEKRFLGLKNLFNPKAVKGIQYDPYGKAVWVLTQKNNKATLSKIKWIQKNEQRGVYKPITKYELAVENNEQPSFYIDDEGYAWFFSPAAKKLTRFYDSKPTEWSLRDLYPFLTANQYSPFSIFGDDKLVLGYLIDPATLNVTMVNLQAPRMEGYKPTSMVQYSVIESRKDFALNGLVTYKIAVDSKGDHRLVVYENHNGKSYYVSQALNPHTLEPVNGESLSFNRSSLQLEFNEGKDIKNQLARQSGNVKVYEERKSAFTGFIPKGFVEIKNPDTEEIIISELAGVELTKDWDSWVTFTDEGKVVFLQSDITADSRVLKGKYITGTYDPISKSIAWSRNWQILRKTSDATQKENGIVRRVDQKIVGLTSTNNRVFTLLLGRDGRNRLLELDLEENQGTALTAEPSPPLQRSEMRSSAKPLARSRYDIARMRITPPLKTGGRLLVWDSNPEENKKIGVKWRGSNTGIEDAEAQNAKAKIQNTILFINERIENQKMENHPYKLKKILESMKRTDRKIELVNIPGLFREDFAESRLLSLNQIVDMRYKNRTILLPFRFLQYLQIDAQDDREKLINKKVLAFIILKAMEFFSDYEEEINGLLHNAAEGEFPSALSGVYEKLGESFSIFSFQESDEILQWLGLSTSDLENVLTRVKSNLLAINKTNLTDDKKMQPILEKIKELSVAFAGSRSTPGEADYLIRRANHYLPSTSIAPRETLPDESLKALSHRESERALEIIRNVFEIKPEEADFGEVRLRLTNFIWTEVIPVAYDYQRKGDLRNADVWFNNALLLMDLLIKIDYKGGFPLAVMKDKIRLLAQIGRIEEAYVEFYKMLSAEYVPADLREDQKNIHYSLGNIYDWLKEEGPKLILKAIWFRSVEDDPVREKRLLEIQERLNLWLEKIEDPNKAFEGFYADLTANRSISKSKKATALRALNGTHHTVSFEWEKSVDSQDAIHVSINAYLSFSGGASMEKIGHFKAIWIKRGEHWIASPESDPEFLKKELALWRTDEGASMHIKYVRQMLIYLHFKLMQKSEVNYFKVGILHPYFKAKRNVGPDTIIILTSNRRLLRVPVLIAEDMERVQSLAFPDRHDRSELRLASPHADIFKLNAPITLKMNGIGLNEKVQQEILIWVSQNPENLKVIILGVGELPQSLKGFPNILLENGLRSIGDEENVITVSYLTPLRLAANSDLNFFSETVTEGFLSAVLLKDQLSDQVFERRNPRDPYLMMISRFRKSAADWFQELWNHDLVASSA